jgi:hypothetical protein
MNEDQAYAASFPRVFQQGRRLGKAFGSHDGETLIFSSRSNDVLAKQILFALLTNISTV